LEIGLGLDDAAHRAASDELAYQNLAEEKTRERNRAHRYRGTRQRHDIGVRRIGYPGVC